MQMAAADISLKRAPSTHDPGVSSPTTFANYATHHTSAVKVSSDGPHWTSAASMAASHHSSHSYKPCFAQPCILNESTKPRHRHPIDAHALNPQPRTWLQSQKGQLTKPYKHSDVAVPFPKSQLLPNTTALCTHARMHSIDSQPLRPQQENIAGQ